MCDSTDTTPTSDFTSLWWGTIATCYDVRHDEEDAHGTPKLPCGIYTARRGSRWGEAQGGQKAGGRGCWVVSYTLHKTLHVYD